MLYLPILISYIFDLVSDLNKKLSFILFKKKGLSIS